MTSWLRFLMVMYISLGANGSQSSETIPMLPGESTSDAFGSDFAKASISSSTTGSTAVLKISGYTAGKDSGDNSDAGRFTSWAFSVSSPFNQNSKSAEPANLDGLANDAQVTAGWNWGSVGINLNDYKNTKERLEECKLKQIIPCDLPTPNAPTSFLFGVSLSAGHKTYDFIDLDNEFKETKGTKTPTSLDIHYSKYFKSSPTIFSFGVKYQDSFKDQKAALICPVATSTNYLSCMSGPVKAPQHQTSHQVYIRMNHQFSQRSSSFFAPAVSLQITKDFKNEKLGVDLPVFLFSDSEKKLTGGIRFGWTDVEGDLNVGVFFAGSFSGI